MVSYTIGMVVISEDGNAAIVQLVVLVLVKPKSSKLEAAINNKCSFC